VDRVLVIDHRVATPDRDAGSLRMVNLIRVLTDLGQEVTYLPQTISDRAERQQLSTICDSLSLQVPQERSVRRHLKRHRSTYRAAILCRVGPTEAFLPQVRRFCPRAWTLFDTVDLHHLREMRQAEIDKDSNLRAAALEVRQRELDLLDAADETLVVSTFEEELLREHDPEAKIRVVPPIHEIRPSSPSLEKRQGLLFVAGFEHQPNVDAALWLVEDIMPWVWEKLPGVGLTLVGSHPPAVIRALQSDKVTITGYVPRVDPYLDTSRLSLAPLRYGAGVKGKVTESMASGLPVVATPIACEGMPIEDERDILVAEEAGEFAAAVVRACSDEELWHRLAANSRETATRHFSFDSARQIIETLLSDISNVVDGGSAGS